MLEYFTVVVGSIMGLSFLPQAWRIVQLKRSEEISIPTFAFIVFGACTWLVYGATQHDTVIIIANICGLIGAGSVLITALYYRGKKSKEQL